MKIDRIELFHVAIPLPEPFYPAWIPGYPQTVNRFTLLRLTTDDGVQGLAAGLAFEREREGLGGLLGPYLVGTNPTDIHTVRQRLREATYLGWRNYWIEAACWDIRGKVEGKPVWALLGGTEAGRVPVYASTGEVHRPEQRADEALQLREMGFKMVKLRVHSFNRRVDEAQVEAVRKAVGDSMDIAVDANQGWRVTLVDDAPLWDLQRASEFAQACGEQGVRWLEEPLDMHAYDQLSELCGQSPVPIAGGELNGGWHEFKVMLEKGSYDIYQPDATLGGGPRDYPLEYPYEPPGWVPEARDGLLAEPVRVDGDGTVAVPTAPGLGIELDVDRLRRYGEKYFEITSRGMALKTIREKGVLSALRLARKRRR